MEKKFTVQSMVQIVMLVVAFAFLSGCGLGPPEADIFGVEVSTFSDHFLKGGGAHFFAEVIGGADQSVTWAVLDENGYEVWEDQLYPGLKFETSPGDVALRPGEVFLLIPSDYPHDSITVRATYANARDPDDPRNFGETDIILVPGPPPARPESIGISNVLNGFFRDSTVLLESQTNWVNGNKPDGIDPRINLEAVVWHIVEGATEGTRIEMRNGLLFVDQFQRVNVNLVIRATMIHFGISATVSAIVRPDFSIEIIPPSGGVPRGGSGAFGAEVIASDSTATGPGNVRWSVRNVGYAEVNGQVVSQGRPAAAYINNGVLTVSAAEQGEGFNPVTGEGYLWVEAASWDYPDITELRRISIGGRAPVPSDFRIVHAGAHYTLALDWEGQLWTWGHGATGILGNGRTDNYSAPAKVTVNDGNTRFAYICSGGVFNDYTPSVSTYYALAIAEDGTLWAWGNNNNGKTGLGQVSGSQYTPKQVTSRDGIDNAWVHVSAGTNHSLGIRRDGTLWGWGRWFRVGLSSSSNISVTDILSPVRIGNDTDWMFVEVGNEHSLAVKTDGTLWAWGANSKGQLGGGTGADVVSPRLVGALDNARVSMALAGDGFSAAIDAEKGEMWVWGLNSDSPDGIPGTSSFPVKVSIGDAELPLRYASVHTTGWHILAIDNKGHLYGLGSNKDNRFGPTSLPQAKELIKLDNDHTYFSTSAGGGHSIVLRNDNQVHYGIGQNKYGQLGQGTLSDDPESNFVPINK